MPLFHVKESKIGGERLNTLDNSVWRRVTEKWRSSRRMRSVMADAADGSIDHPEQCDLPRCAGPGGI
tara:strand:- start:68455 stop:68655 length:201 start_codon:yes stop_codon:yes gene_type:complete